MFEINPLKNHKQKKVISLKLLGNNSNVVKCKMLKLIFNSEIVNITVILGLLYEISLWYLLFH